jgi:hypothetical protein
MCVLKRVSIPCVEVTENLLHPRYILVTASQDVHSAVPSQLLEDLQNVHPSFALPITGLYSPSIYLSLSLLA